MRACSVEDGAAQGGGFQGGETDARVGEVDSRDVAVCCQKCLQIPVQGPTAGGMRKSIGTL